MMEEDGDPIIADEEAQIRYEHNITVVQEHLDDQSMTGFDAFNKSNPLIAYSRTHSKEEKKANAQV